jgi:hypothetical protein
MSPFDSWAPHMRDLLSVPRRTPESTNRMGSSPESRPDGGAGGVPDRAMCSMVAASRLPMSPGLAHAMHSREPRPEWSAYRRISEALADRRSKPHSERSRTMRNRRSSTTPPFTDECNQVVGGLVDFRISAATGRVANEGIPKASSGPQSRHLHARAVQGTVFYPPVKRGGSSFFSEHDFSPKIPRRPSLFHSPPDTAPEPNSFTPRPPPPPEHTGAPS